MKTFCPIYEKDGHELIVLTKDFIADTHEEAWKIAMGSMLVECIVLGMKYKEVREIDSESLPHQKANLGGVPVALLSGPGFERAVAATAADPDGIREFFVTIAANMPRGAGYYRVFARDHAEAREKAFRHCPDGRWSFMYDSLDAVHEFDRKHHGDIG